MEVLVRDKSPIRSDAFRCSICAISIECREQPAISSFWQTLASFKKMFSNFVAISRFSPFSLFWLFQDSRHVTSLTLWIFKVFYPQKKVCAHIISFRKEIFSIACFSFKKLSSFPARSWPASSICTGMRRQLWFADCDGLPFPLTRRSFFKCLKYSIFELPRPRPDKCRAEYCWILYQVQRVAEGWCCLILVIWECLT